METLPEGFARRSAEVNGTTLSYLAGGEGDPLVLLHGWPQTARAWLRVLEPLAREGFSVVAPDLRGLGESARARSGYDKDNQAEDVYALLGSLGLDHRVHIVGHDIGAMVAFAYARRHPESVERLVLADVAIPGLGLERAMDVANGGRWHFGLFMTPEMPELLFAGHEHEFFRKWFSDLSATPGAIDEETIAEIARSYSGVESLRAGFEHYRTLLADGEVNRTWFENGGRLTMPVLAIGGEHGAGTRLAAGVRPAVPGVVPAVVAGSGHFVAEEDPAEFLSILVPFLHGKPAVDTVSA
ncbi:alpha/beta fold hydrolase [Amycolatopsis jejuensis]|uniref:alpha/beta fold hydrolase n=1 Tax=Amycolatopsis jejuensis TaxID=330084 RepID=UPI00052570DD|nr:alpha/beta hydrolase [Amycolatopsis jejuensis]